MIRNSALFLFATYFLASASIAVAQPADKVGRLGFLGFDAVASKTFIEAFRRGLAELGYVDGRDVVIETRWAGGRINQLPALAAEMVGLKVDIIVGVGAVVAQAAKSATTSPRVTRAGQMRSRS